MPHTSTDDQAGRPFERIDFRMSTAVLLAMLAIPGQSTAQDDGIEGDPGNAEMADFDIVHARITIEGSEAIFRMTLSGEAGAAKPTPTGKLAGSEVFAYVWPTSMDPAVAGFEAGAGILAMAVTAHPDFDDTPLFDENGDEDTENDGDIWHSHWVVLGPDEACGPGALKVIDIPEGTNPPLPATWPGLALLIDSPGYEPSLEGETVELRVSFDDISVVEGASYDAVTSGLRVNANMHAPLLCVADAFDVASGDLSLPGVVGGQ